MDTYTVKSHTSDKSYVVTYNNQQWSCSCPGWGYRRHCSHIDEVKQQINEVFKHAYLDAPATKFCTCGNKLSGTHYTIGICQQCIMKEVVCFCG